MNPTYHSLGDHTESIEIDYDPAAVSYEDLLAIFWEGHDPWARPWSTQYKAAIFYRNDEQRRLAEESRKRIAAKQKTTVRTEIVPFSTFYTAEAYHQKYSVRSQPEIMKEFRAIYSSDDAFMNSTATARVNGYLNGLSDFESVREAVGKIAISAQTRERLLAEIRKHGERFGRALCGRSG